MNGTVYQLWPDPKQERLAREYERRVSENEGKVWAMPSARAATPSGLNGLRRFRASIASLSQFLASADFILGAAYGGIFGMLAVLVPAIITAWWVR